MKTIPMLLLLACCFNLEAQPYFQKSFGDSCYDEAYSIFLNSHNTYSVAGYTCSYNNTDDVYLAKVNSNGNLLWSRAIEIRRQERAYSVIESTADSGPTYVLTGDTHNQNSHGTGPDKAFLLITNSIGVPTLVSTYGPDSKENHGRCVIETSDRNYLIAGFAKSNCDTLADSCAFCHDVFLAKTDKLGNLIWGEYIDINGNDDYGYKVVEANGKYMITGYTKRHCSNADVFLMQVTFTGIVDWVKSYGTDLNDFSFSLKATPDYGYIMVGHTEGYGSNLKPDILAIKTDINGVPAWKTIYDTHQHHRENFGRDVVVGDDGYYITGYSDVIKSGSYDMQLVKIDNAGAMQWQNVYGDIEDDRGYALQLLPDGVAMAGYTHSYGRGLSDVYLVKTDFNGETCLRTVVDTNYEYTDTLYNDELFTVDKETIRLTETYRYIDVRDQDSICSMDSIPNDSIHHKSVLPYVSRQAEMEFSIYPNPIANGGELNVEVFSPVETLVTIQLRDNLGRTLFETKRGLVKGNNKTSIKTNELKRGIYYLDINDSCFRKIVIIE